MSFKSKKEKLILHTQPPTIFKMNYKEPHQWEYSIKQNGLKQRTQ